MEHQEQYLTSEERNRLKLINEYRPKLAKLLGLQEKDVFPKENEEEEDYV